MLNTLLPGGLGAGEYHPRMHVEDHKWFCSQLVGCALQAMADDEAVAATAAPVTAARNSMRAAGQLLVLLAAVTAGLVTGLALKGAGAASSSVCALAGTSVGAVTLLALSALMGFVVAAMSPRRQVYARRGAPNDWRGVVCRQTALHKSSPNSLYDTLYGNRGVYPSRDPHGKALSLGGGV